MKHARFRFGCDCLKSQRRDDFEKNRLYEDQNNTRAQGRVIYRLSKKLRSHLISAPMYSISANAGAQCKYLRGLRLSPLASSPNSAVSPETVRLLRVLPSPITASPTWPLHNSVMLSHAKAPQRSSPHSWATLPTCPAGTTAFARPRWTSSGPSFSQLSLRTRRSRRWLLTAWSSGVRAASTSGSWQLRRTSTKRRRVNSARKSGLPRAV